MIGVLVTIGYLLVGIFLSAFWHQKSKINDEYKLEGANKIWVVICWLPIVLIS